MVMNLAACSPVLTILNDSGDGRRSSRGAVRGGSPSPDRSGRESALSWRGAGRHGAGVRGRTAREAGPDNDPGGHQPGGAGRPGTAAASFHAGAPSGDGAVPAGTGTAVPPGPP